MSAGQWHESDARDVIVAAMLGSWRGRNAALDLYRGRHGFAVTLVLVEREAALGTLRSL